MLAAHATREMRRLSAQKLGKYSIQKKKPGEKPQRSFLGA